VPPNYELVRKHALIVEGLHKCVQILLLRRISLDKVQHNCLHQTLDANLAIVFDQLQEGTLVVSPMLDDVTILGEDAREEDEVFVLRGDVHDQLGLAHFCQQVVDGAFRLVDKGTELVDYSIHFFRVDFDWLGLQGVDLAALL